MAFVWSWLTGVGLASSLMLASLAVLVFLKAPSQSANRALARLAWIDAIWVANSAMFYANDSLRVVSSHQLVIFAFLPLSMLAYLHLLAFLPGGHLGKLDSPLIRRIMTVSGLSLAVMPLLFRDAFIGGWVEPSYAPYESIFGPAAVAAIMIYAALTIFGLGAAIWARAKAQSQVAKAQATGFVVAFAVRDAMLFAATALTSNTETEWRLLIGGALLPLLSAGAFALLAAYSILRFQTFEIDLRLKTTISRGTLAAIFLAVFFVVGTIASEFLVDRLGFGIGGLAAGLLLFAINPLQRLGERVADAAMPGVQDTPEYRARRSREVYQAAWEGMLADGKVTEKEKDVLASLAQDLGLGPKDVRSIERVA